MEDDDEESSSLEVDKAKSEQAEQVEIEAPEVLVEE